MVSEHEPWQDREWRTKLDKQFETDDLAGNSELRGVIDSHIHIGPEMSARRTDAEQLARDYRDAGARAILIKPFEFSSHSRAYFAKKMVPGIEVYGSFTLGSGTGGINPLAVQKGLDLGAMAIWLPIWNTAQMFAEQTLKNIPKYQNWNAPKHPRPPKPEFEQAVVVKDGKLTPEIIDILHLVKDAGVFLGTSHISPDESIAVCAEAKKLGVRVSCTHVNSPTIGATHEQIKKMAELGAFIEFNFTYCFGWWWFHTPDVLAAMIRTATPERSIFVSDGGQTMSPYPHEVLRLFIRTMKLEGFTQREIDLMTKENPARLLGI